MAVKWNKRVMLITILVLVASMVLAGCNKSNEDAVAKVNGQYILKADFDKNFDMLKKTYEASFGSDIMSKSAGNGKTIEETLKEKILEKLIIEEIILQNAEKSKVKVTDEDVTKEIDNYKNLVGGDEGFQEFLEKNNMTEDFFKKGMKREMIMEGFKENFIKTLNFSDEDIEKQFNENKDSYISVRASHILVEKESEAKDILNKLKNGEDFAELAKQNSIDPGTAQNGGDLGYFSKGEMVPEFEKAAFELNPGEISDVIKSDYGYHIIKVMDKQDTLQQLKDQVVQQLQNKKYDEKLNKLHDDSKIEILMSETK